MGTAAAAFAFVSGADADEEEEEESAQVQVAGPRWLLRNVSSSESHSVRFSRPRALHASPAEHTRAQRSREHTSECGVE